MSDIDLAPLQNLLLDLAPQGRTALIPALQAAQRHYGWLPEPVAAAVAQALRVPLADVYGVIDFYSLLHSKPVPQATLQVCTDPVCALRGASHLLSAASQVSLDGSKVPVEAVHCLGLCAHAPAALFGEQPLGNLTLSGMDQLFTGGGKAPRTAVSGSPRVLTALCGGEQAASLAEYQAAGGYTGLRQALHMTRQQVIGLVKASGLVGRGGAAFPTGVKWEGAAEAPGEVRYVVCNADESEPGTFKDRVLLEDDPHRTLEGLLIAAYAIGAHKAYIYLRGEYPVAYQRILHALDDAGEAGLLGENILGSPFSCEVELRQGAGAYICGEETALFESIEGKRGLPRIKPPFPTTSGLFGQPTAINNVETLCNVPSILAQGAETYRLLGTSGSPGTKLFCISGDVVQPGLVEVSFGATLRTLLDEYAGGLPAGRRLGAVLVGGAAGAFATERDLDVPLTFEDLRAAGLPLGSGVLMVFDDSRDLRQVLLGIGRFFAHESCGKCYPCQMGTQRQVEILERLAGGQPLPEDPERLADVGWTMVDASLCGLGQTAASAVLNAMQHWPDLFRPAGQV